MLLFLCPFNLHAFQMAFFFIIYMLQEFILRNAGSKKSQTSNLQEGLSKKSLNDYHQVKFDQLPQDLNKQISVWLLVVKLEYHLHRWLTTVKVLDAAGKRFLRVLENRYHNLISLLI